MMSYPLEKDKGKAFGVFWAIYQLGSLIGSLVALVINLRKGGLSAVSTSTYIVRRSTHEYLRSRPYLLVAFGDVLLSQEDASAYASKADAIVFVTGFFGDHLRWCGILVPDPPPE